MNWCCITESICQSIGSLVLICLLTTSAIISIILRYVNCWRIHVSWHTNIVSLDINNFGGSWVESPCVPGIVTESLFKLPRHVLYLLTLKLLQFVLELYCSVSLFDWLRHLGTNRYAILFRFFRGSYVLVSIDIQFICFYYVWNILIISFSSPLWVIRLSYTSFRSFSWLSGVPWSFIDIDCFLKYLSSCVLSIIWRVCRWV